MEDVVFYCQNVDVNILDADTREIIPYNFVIWPYPLDGYLSPQRYWVIRNGCDTINLPVRDLNPTVSFFLEQKCIESTSFKALGYDQNFVAVDSSYGSGYDISRPIDEVFTLPRVINLYLRKKDSPNA